MKKYVIPNISMLRKSMNVMQTEFVVFSDPTGAGEQLGNEGEFEEKQSMMGSTSVWDK